MALLATDPVDLLLDSDGDIVVRDGDLVWARGVDAVAQIIRIRLLMFKGEWFANLDAGVPYYQDLLGQKYDEAKVQDAMRAAITGAPGVAEVLSLRVTFNGATRSVRVDWEVRCEFGDTASGSQELG